MLKKEFIFFVAFICASCSSSAKEQVAAAQKQPEQQKKIFIEYLAVTTTGTTLEQILNIFKSQKIKQAQKIGAVVFLLQFENDPTLAKLQKQILRHKKEVKSVEPNRKVWNVKPPVGVKKRIINK